MDHVQESPQRPTQTRLILAPSTVISQAAPVTLDPSGSDTVAPTAPRSSPLLENPSLRRSSNTELLSPPRALVGPKVEDSQTEAAVFFKDDPRGFSTMNKPMSLKEIRARGMDPLVSVSGGPAVHTCVLLTCSA